MTYFQLFPSATVSREAALRGSTEGAASGVQVSAVGVSFPLVWGGQGSAKGLGFILVRGHSLMAVFGVLVPSKSCPSGCCAPRERCQPCSWVSPGCPIVFQCLQTATWPKKGIH